MSLSKLLQLADTNKIALHGYFMPPAALESFVEDRKVSVIQSTNAIEGNTLTLMETKIVLEGYSVPNKLLREIWEAINIGKALDYMDDVIKQGLPLSEEIIKGINAIVLRNINEMTAGVYRNVNVRIVGASFSPPSPQELCILMENLLAQYLSSLYEPLHAIEKASKLHTDFVRIHPFEDGNGRTARLLMNSELQRHGFPMISITNRAEYLNALETFNVSGRYEPLSIIIAQEVINEQELIKTHSLKQGSQ